MIYLVWVTYIVLQLLVTVVLYTGLMLIAFFILEKVKAYLERLKTKRRDRRREKEYEEHLRRYRKEDLERKLHRIEKRKYPLFYLKDGIV